MRDKTYGKGLQGMRKCAHTDCEQEATFDSNLCYYHKSIADGKQQPTRRGHQAGGTPK